MKYGIYAAVAMCATISTASAEGGCPCISTNGDSYVSGSGQTFDPTQLADWGLPELGSAVSGSRGSDRMQRNMDRDRIFGEDVARLGDGGPNWSW